jgi:hypothetical protein
MNMRHDAIIAGDTFDAEARPGATFVSAGVSADLARIALDRPASGRTQLYLVGEHERTTAKPAVATAGRTMICINGHWHSMRGNVATFEQILALAYPDRDPNRATSLSVTFRRGAPGAPQGSLTPGDVVPIVEGMLVNANATILS